MAFTLDTLEIHFNALFDAKLSIPRIGFIWQTFHIISIVFCYVFKYIKLFNSGHYAR